MAKTKTYTIRLNPEDNVEVALTDLEPGVLIAQDTVVCRERIPAGHKVAVQKVRAGAAIRKYGHTIGFASQDVEAGHHVHTHNVELGDLARDYAIGRDAISTQFFSESNVAHFEGIIRSDGSVGTRNYVGILATVNCSASVARFVAEQFSDEIMAEFPKVDGVVSLGHGSGCGMVSDGEGFQVLQRTLAGYARHPNFAGVLLVGLGCEVNQVDSLIENMELTGVPLLKAVNIQQAGGTRDSVQRCTEIVKEMLSEANRVERQPVPASHILLGLECGGSDAYSGISANPALGAAVDLLVRSGGTAILSETPEIYGAEHLLTRRAASHKVGEKLIELIRWWEEYTALLGAEINNNPTPGNKAGGITSVFEKSLGAAAKAGSTNLVEIYRYAEPVVERGLVFMDTPGYDAVSVTGMIAGGANMICFTTGRGTVCGFKPVPTIKIASNTEMYRRLRMDMDVNCGAIVDGDASIEKMGEDIFRLILETASGKRTKSELLGFGDNEFVPWNFGPVL